MTRSDLTSKVLPICVIACAAFIAALVYHRLGSPLPLRARAPVDAIMVIELDKPIELVREVTRTRAWTRLATSYDLPENETQFASQLASRLGPEWEKALPLLGSSRILFIVTRADITATELAPEFVVVVEPARSLWGRPTDWERWLDVLLPRLGLQPERQSSREGYRDPVAVRLPRSDKKLYFAQDQNSLLVGNRAEAVKHVIDSRKGRTPAVKGPNLDPHRQGPSLQGRIFGASRVPALARLVLGGFASRMRSALGGDSSDEGPLLLDLKDAPVELEFAIDFEDGMTVDRYLWRLDPEWQAKWQQIFPGPREGPELLKLTPPSAWTAMLLRTENLKTSWSLLRAHMEGPGEGERASILSLLAGRWGQKAGIPWDAQLLEAVGSEILILEPTPGELLWAIPVKSKAPLASAIGRYFKAKSQSPTMTMSGSFLLTTSDDPQSLSFALGEHCMIAGPPGPLRTLLGQIDEKAWMASNLETLRPHGKGMEAAFEISVSQETGGAAIALETVAGWLGSTLPRRSPAPGFSMPRTSRISRWTSDGIYMETRSPLGNVGTLIAASRAGSGDADERPPSDGASENPGLTREGPGQHRRSPRRR